MNSPKKHCYKYPRPALAVDAVVFALDNDSDPLLKVLLIQRGLEPFLGSWALPGGFLQSEESVETAVRRELEEETALRLRTLIQVGTFSNPNRDPREHVVTVAFLALVRLKDHKISEGSDAANAAWFTIDELPKLAFDHDCIIAEALEKLRSMTSTSAIGFNLLPEKFPLRALQSLNEQILGITLDKRNFRRKVMEEGLLVELNEYEVDVHHRAARLYQFDKKNCERIWGNTPLNLANKHNVIKC